MNILLVCTGNTCRSSMAEGIFKEQLKYAGRDDFFVSSAGISAFEGDLANEKSIRVLKEAGIDISLHRARQLTKDLIESSDLILTMTVAHKETINRIIVDSSAMTEGNKVHTLKEYAQLVSGEKVNRSNLDIADPYGMDYNVYKKTMREIETEIKKIIEKIQS